MYNFVNGHRFHYVLTYSGNWKQRPNTRFKFSCKWSGFMHFFFSIDFVLVSEYNKTGTPKPHHPSNGSWKSEITHNLTLLRSSWILKWMWTCTLVRAHMFNGIGVPKITLVAQIWIKEACNQIACVSFHLAHTMIIYG